MFQLKGQRSAHQGLLDESDKERKRKSQYVEYFDNWAEDEVALRIAH